MNLLTAKKLIEYFNEFIENPETAVITEATFLKYLVIVKKFDPSMLIDVKQCYKDNPEVLSYVKTVAEGVLTEGGLLGTLHNSMSQFVLKHKHGYVDNVTESSSGVSEISVTFK